MDCTIQTTCTVVYTVQWRMQVSDLRFIVWHCCYIVLHVIPPGVSYTIVLCSSQRAPFNIGDEDGIYWTGGLNSVGSVTCGKPFCPANFNSMGHCSHCVCCSASVYSYVCSLILCWKYINANDVLWCENSLTNCSLGSWYFSGLTQAQPFWLQLVY